MTAEPRRVSTGSGLPRWCEAPLALVALAGAAPLLAILAMAVRLGSPGPVLFRQRRVGRFGHPFVLLKFRTMRQSTGGPKVTASDDPRITRIGRFLRRTKLDELPELWNIVVGEMSFVGPRPEVPEAVDLADPVWQQVLDARPGLTDPITLRLRDEETLLASVPEGERAAFYRDVLQPWKLRGYVDYLERCTPWRDLGVLAATARAILDPSSIEPPTLDELGRPERNEADPVKETAS